MITEVAQHFVRDEKGVAVRFDRLGDDRGELPFSNEADGS
jgi:hypothetical protein